MRVAHILRTAVRALTAIAPLLVVGLLLVADVHGQEGGRRGRGRGVRWPNVLGRDAEWYAGEDAVRIADNVLLYQNSNGGWPKNIDMARQLSDVDKEKLERERDRSETIIDNGATHTQIRYLAAVYSATKDERYKAACLRGIEFLLAAQYENGGWPMIYPLQKGYYSHITFNDGAMIGVMRLLREVAEGKKPFAFVDQSVRASAATAIEKGVDVILKCQIVVDGKPTGWCAQHDEHDYSPAKARAYELPSLSGSEGVGIVEYLMSIDNPSPEVRAAVRNAVAWFEAAAIHGYRVDRVRNPELDPPRDVVMVEDADGGPLWGRFIAIGTNKPMFVGRDGIVREHLADIEHERRTGYSYVGAYARDLIEKKYPAWREKWGEPTTSDPE
jgi:PelA/Pel-15E family pectate lyase